MLKQLESMEHQRAKLHRQLSVARREIVAARSQLESFRAFVDHILEDFRVMESYPLCAAGLECTHACTNAGPCAKCSERLARAVQCARQVGESH